MCIEHLNMLQQKANGLSYVQINENNMLHMNNQEPQTSDFGHGHDGHTESGPILNYTKLKTDMF